jgi:hypothetical protein
MLLIHWTEHNNIKEILANGIRPTRKQRDTLKVKGVWCFPYTRNKSHNNIWKRQLKSWTQRKGNYNGVVFRLSKDDFPLYAGPFWATVEFEETLAKSEADIKNRMNHFIHGNTVVDGVDYIDYDFEIILPKKIAPERIIKIIKDRAPRKKKE